MVHSAPKTKVLVTGGAGYIGSSVCSALIDHQYEPVILDNLCQGPKAFTAGRIFYEGDVSDRSLIAKIFREQGSIEFAVHCAALIVVPESVTHPEIYYRENVCKSIDFFSAMRDHGCRKIVFSSSAAIYDVVDGFKVKEDSPLKPSSPYARSKAMMEQILQDFCHAYHQRCISLRYFNPIGADPRYRTGPYVKDPSHILGKLISASTGQIPEFQITGTNWPTRDGTGIRDYIHVWDLALAHVKAIENFELAFSKPQPAGLTLQNYRVINLGQGQGVTVKELVAAFERVSGQVVQKSDAAARPGDVAGSFAGSETAQELIDWSAKQSVDEAIRSTLEWSKRYH